MSTLRMLEAHHLATPLSTRFVGVDDEGLENAMTLLGNLKRVIAKPEDIANGARYLASHEGRCVSRHNLFIDGGFRIVNPSFHMFQWPEES